MHGILLHILPVSSMYCQYHESYMLYCATWTCWTSACPPMSGQRWSYSDQVSAQNSPLKTTILEYRYWKKICIIPRRLKIIGKTQLSVKFKCSKSKSNSWQLFKYFRREEEMPILKILGHEEECDQDRFPYLHYICCLSTCRVIFVCLKPTNTQNTHIFF